MTTHQFQVLALLGMVGLSIYLFAWQNNPKLAASVLFGTMAGWLLGQYLFWNHRLESATMNIAEALTTPAVRAGDAWFRPVGWRSTNSAFVLKDGRSYRVPSSRGGVLGMTPDATELAGDWEVVTPDTVLDEREALLSE
jgi:hypothetical protein